LRAGGDRNPYTPENEQLPILQQTSPLPIGISIAGGAKNGESYDDEYDEYAERTFVDRRDHVALFPDHIRDEDEQRHLRNLEEQDIDYSSYAHNGRYRSGDDHASAAAADLQNSWTDADLNSLQEGDRLGIGLLHEGHLIIDALEGSSSTTMAIAQEVDDGADGGAQSPIRSPDDGIQFEIVRQLGYGSYAIVYLVKEILYEPPSSANYHYSHGHEEHLFVTDEDDALAEHEGKTIYGREFALKCLSKKNLTDEQITVQKFEATLHRALPEHPNVVALHRVGFRST